MIGKVLVIHPDGTQEVVERELPEIEPIPEPEYEPTTEEILNAMLGVAE